MRKLETFNPATGERIAELEITTSKEIQAMVGKAKKAQIKWAEKSIRDRANIIIKAYEEIKNRTKQMADMIHVEMGKICEEALGEVESSIKKIWSTNFWSGSPLFWSHIKYHVFDGILYTCNVVRCC